MSKLQTLATEKQELLLEKYQEINSNEARKLVKQLALNINESYDLEKREGFQFETDGKEVKFVILSNTEDTLKVIYVNADGDERLMGSVIVQEGDKKILKGYQVVDNDVKKVAEFEVDEDFLNQAKNNPNIELPESREEIISQAECIYGNWCGPGCSGPGAPISAVDTCCQKHDRCYGSRGYFACSCDNELEKCLQPYVLAGSEWAILVWGWFGVQPCIPFI